LPQGIDDGGEELANLEAPAELADKLAGMAHDAAAHLDELDTEGAGMMAVTGVRTRTRA